MPGLLHGFGKRNTSVRGLSEIARANTVCREFSWIEAGQRRSVLDDVVDRLRIQRTLGNIAPAIDLLKYAAVVDPRCRKPGI